MTQEYLERKRVDVMPHLPLEGSIDLTYRCNNNCRHCWLKIPADSKDQKYELSFDAIKKIADESRAMGCRHWSVSGGEPMLRSDFSEIFDYLTKNSDSYGINTNGSLITPKIAKLLKRPGTKMVALYGATAQVHDHITRNPGSFEQTLRGMKYLREQGAGFIVQLVPMRDNYHQFTDMVRLAESLSKHSRIGASWLYLSACGCSKKNKEIVQQRLSAKKVIEMDKPISSFDDFSDKKKSECHNSEDGDYFFTSCVNSKNSFHVDPYGKSSFCFFVKEPSLRYDLAKGNFSGYWNRFLPSLAYKIKITKKYKDNCGSCLLRKECRWCPAYGYLEHSKFDAKVDYLCAIAKENKAFKRNWIKNYRRYFKIADITIQVESDLPFDEDTFRSKFKLFEVAGPGKDTIVIRHHFFAPDFNINDLGKEIYKRPPWAIYRKNDSWIYLGISSIKKDKTLHKAVVFNNDYTRVIIYNYRKDIFLKGDLASLTLFPTDQIMLARTLANREACFFHSSGIVFDDKGFLFIGRSGAGKSTMIKKLRGKAESLCDERIIVRKHRKGFKIYGTWSHGELPDVSPGSASLKGIFFLKKSHENKAVRLDDKKIVVAKLLSCLVKPLVTIEWWDKTLNFIDKIANDVPCYILESDKSGKVVDVLRKI